MSLTLSIIELSVLLFFAIILGVVIHFFITSRRNLKGSVVEVEKSRRIAEDWKLKYFNETKQKGKEVSELKARLSESEENDRVYNEQVEELKRKNERMQAELDSMKKPEVPGHQPNYIEQLKMAQASLLEHNEKINQLLENIELVKENEEKQKLMEEENHELMAEVKTLRSLLGQKDAEIRNIREKEEITKEMNSMLDSAYSEFNTLQSKIQKLESQLSSNKMISLEYEDLKEAYYKISREHEDYKHKLEALTSDNQHLTSQLNDAEDKYREAHFQRQQLQKRVNYLEELNRDLQLVAETNKKLEHQIRRIGELESMLNVVSEENQILKQQAGQ